MIAFDSSISENLPNHESSIWFVFCYISQFYLILENTRKQLKIVWIWFHNRSNCLTLVRNSPYNRFISSSQIDNPCQPPRDTTIVKTNTGSYLSNRVLKINVGFLLSAGPGNSHDSRFDIPEPVRVADDLLVNSINGTLRLTRTHEGILVQSQLYVGVESECSRCLDVIQHDIELTMEELYNYPTRANSEFFVGADAILDLAPLLRAEVLIETGHRFLCREECKGLCPDCGTNLNYETCDCADKRIDPRLSKLRELLDSKAE